ncbi:MAG: hypothetical protein WAM09_09845 [Anaerolineales bacterium]|jgi:hypothetical protein
MLKKLRRVLSLGLLLFSGYLLIWAILSSMRQVVVQSISPSEMQIPSSGEPPIPSILESRQVILEWPASMRIGDNGIITLIFEPIQKDAPSPDPQAELTNVYNNYNLMAEARIEAVGIKVDPANPTRESMPSGQSVKFKWQVSVEQAGSYNCNLWLSLRFLPLDGSQASQVPIYVHEVEIHATSLVGMSGPVGRLLGGMGIIFSILVIFDDMIGLVTRWMKKRTTKVTKGTKDLE